MHGAERDGEEDLRGEVEFVAVAQQHAETTIDKKRAPQRNLQRSLYRIMYVRLNQPAWP